MMSISPDDLSRMVQEKLQELEKELKSFASCSPLAIALEHVGIGVQLSVQLVALPPKAETVENPVNVQEVGQIKPATYTQTRQALAKLLPRFGRKKFMVADAVELLKRNDFLGCDRTHVSLILSTNQVPGMKFAKIRTKDGNRKINMYRKTR